MESSGVPKAFTEMTKHLNEKHGEFFKHWDQLLTKEEKGTVRFRREVWTMTSSERESAGRCFGSLVIKPGSVSVDQNNQKVNKYTYTFRKQTTLAGFTFRDSQLGEGDPIVISDEKGHIALAIGFIYRVTQTEITAMVDRRLHNARTQQKNFNEDHYQVFNGIVEWKCGSQTPSQIPGGPMEEDIVYRIDKDEFSSGMAHIRNSLVQLMAPDSNEKYRRLIVDLEPPVFKDSPTAYQLDETASQSGLNEDQKRAVLKVMSGEFICEMSLSRGLTDGVCSS